MTEFSIARTPSPQSRRHPVNRYAVERPVSPLVHEWEEEEDDFMALMKSGERETAGQLGGG